MLFAGFSKIWHYIPAAGYEWHFLPKSCADCCFWAESENIPDRAPGILLMIENYFSSGRGEIHTMNNPDLAGSGGMTGFTVAQVM